MNNSIFIALLNNTVLLLALVTLYDLLTVHKQNRKSLFRQTLTGIALGGLGIGLMLASFCLKPGIIFDTRSVLLAMSGLFFGFIPTLIAMGMTAGFRLVQGGTAAWAGSAVIFATGSLGLLWHRLRQKPLDEVSAQELYLFGILIHSIMLALMFIMPFKTAWYTVSQIGIPVLLIYPLATVTLGLLLASRLHRQQTTVALAESQTTYHNLFLNNRAVMLLIDLETGLIAEANPAACHFYGWTNKELCRMKITQINTLPEDQVKTAMQRALSGECNAFRFQHRLADGSLRDVEVLSGPVTLVGRKLLYSIVQDITERHQQDAEHLKILAEAEQTRHALLSVVEDQKLAKTELQLTQFAMDHAVDAAFWVKSDASFVYVNESATRSLGYTRDELLHLSVPDIAPEFTSENWPNHWNKIKQAGSLVLESRHQTKIGEVFPVEIHNSFIRYDDQEYVCAFIHNIANRKQMQEAIEKRVVALTRPLNQADGITFSELFDQEKFQRIQDEFSAATGVASIITHPDGTPITKPSNFTRLCSEIIRKTEKGCSNCFKSDATIGCYHPEGPIIQTCMSGGLWDAGTSISIGGRHIANWLIGQVRDETQTEEKMLKYARQIDADEQQFIAAFREVPLMSRERFEQVAQSLFTLADQLSTSAYQNIQQARFITELKKQEADMRRLSTAIEQSPEAVVITDLDGNIQYVNPAFETITGYSSTEAVNQNSNILKSGLQDASFYSNLWENITTGKTWGGRFINKRKDGTLYTEEATISPIRDLSGVTTGYVAIKRDITEELSKDEQFRQSQKMEAVGQLAGGVAHDFNNILQAILGFSEILLEQLKQDSTEHRNVAEIKKAAKRAAELIRQLLAFSRKQNVDRKLIDLNETIHDTEVLLKILLGEKITFLFDLSPELHKIQADQGQMTQIIINLSVNARDAMPSGGRLTIATENSTFEPLAAAALPGAEPGTFACLSVTDTGCGMSQQVKEHLFEPFFTTKEVGKGTGLGLSVVYGIVKQNNGWMNVYSEEGVGSTFKIYLPICDTGTTTSEQRTMPQENLTARILLVEDDTDTRNLVIRILKTANYETIAAGSVEEGLLLFEQENGRFDLLFSDMMLSGKSGLELADTIRAKNPVLPILLYSAYRDQRERWDNLESKGYHFLQKPFSIVGLLAAVNDVLTNKP